MFLLAIEDKEAICFIQYLNQTQSRSKENIGNNIPELNWQNVYSVLNKHALLALPADIISKLPNIDEKTLTEWKNTILKLVSRNIQVQNVQNRITETLQKKKIRMIIVKGTSAAQYYPNPLLRILGDIDILTHPEDFDRACEIMLQMKAIEKTTEAEKKFGRHRVFAICSQVVEIHRFMASKPGTKEAEILDSLAYNCTEKNEIYADDAINGIIILDHIKKHLTGEGIGLRQILDWHMFVEKCLDNQAWSSGFEALAQKTGLRKLAITITSMCSRYFGLPKEITWGENAEGSLVDKLLEYVMNCGNFGIFREEIDTWSFRNTPSIWKPKSFFRYLQEQGAKKWKPVKKYPFLKHFAWMYQVNRWLRQGIKKRITPSVLVRKKDRERSIKKMMKDLDVI